MPFLLIREGDFGDFGVSFVATVAGRYTRRGGGFRKLVVLVIVFLIKPIGASELGPGKARKAIITDFGDSGDFGVSFLATVARSY